MKFVIILCYNFVCQTNDKGGIYIPIVGKNIGDVHISVYETPTGETLFFVKANNDTVVPVLNYVESSLEKY